jgi:DNA-directed RNA polymerase specialized sigma24 family protein
MEMALSVLKILGDGELYGKSEIDKAVAVEFNIGEEELKEKISCGANKFKNRMGWAVVNLKGKGLIIKEGKRYKISDLGAKALVASPDKLTTKFVKSLSKSDKSADGSDDSDDSDEGGDSGGITQDADNAQEISAEVIPSDSANSAGIDAYAGMDPNTEFMLAVRAKFGDKAAFAGLWNKYRSMMCGMLRFCKNLTEDERVSEAALVFVKKIELFRPERVKKNPEEWTFSYMLTGGVKNARDKIIRHSKKESRRDFDYVDDLPSDTDTDTAYVNAFAASVEINRYEYMEKYSPEVHALRATDVSLEDKQKELLESLSPLQITILKFRQAGLTIQQIADEMGCGFTKVRLQIVEARQTASAIFGVEYS